MTRSIWKFGAPLYGNSLSIEMPRGAEILTVQIQGGSAQIWALVSTETVPAEIRKFRWFGTGHPMPDEQRNTELKYVGTVQMRGGHLIFHLFEERAR